VLVLFNLESALGRKQRGNPIAAFDEALPIQAAPALFLVAARPTVLRHFVRHYMIYFEDSLKAE